MERPGLLTKAGPLVIFLGLCAFFAIGLSKDPRQLQSNLIDKQLPSFELTELFDPEEIITDQSLSGRVTLLNVFGSWCQACLVEHPTLLRLSQESAFDLVGVNWRDTRPDAERWLKKHENPYRYIIFDEHSLLAISLGVTGAPETYVIDSERRVRYKHVGPISPEVLEKTIYPLILDLLEETA